MPHAQGTILRAALARFGLQSVNLLFGCGLMAALAGCGQKKEEAMIRKIIFQGQPLAARN
jgi:hypothetical protein